MGRQVGEFTTATGCRVQILEDPYRNRQSPDETALVLSVDTRFAEVLLTPNEVSQLRKLLEKVQQ